MEQSLETTQLQSPYFIVQAQRARERILLVRERTVIRNVRQADQLEIPSEKIYSKWFIQ